MPVMEPVKLSDVFSKENSRGWYQAFPFGEYQHARYGTVSMDAIKAERVAEQVNASVVGSQLPINYEHTPGPAAGWVEGAEVRPDGLYLDIDWTESGLAKIESKEFKYLSPEYFPKWTHPKSGDDYTDVLVGAALTNNPFLMDIDPITMSREQEGQKMEFAAKLREALKLSADASDDEVLETVGAAVELAETPAEPVQKFSATVEQTADPMEQVKHELSKRGLDDVAQLMTAMEAKVEKLELANRRAKVDAHVDRWSRAPHSFSAATALRRCVRRCWVLRMMWWIIWWGCWTILRRRGCCRLRWRLRCGCRGVSVGVGRMWSRTVQAFSKKSEGLVG